MVTSRDLHCNYDFLHIKLQVRKICQYSTVQYSTMGKLGGGATKNIKVILEDFRSDVLLHLKSETIIFPHFLDL